MLTTVFDHEVLDFALSLELSIRTPQANTDKTLQDALATTEYEVFNRHVTEGLIDKDDRESPKIAMLFAHTRTTSPHHINPSPHLAGVIHTRVLNMRITGKFGYTDPDFDAGRTVATAGGDSITAPNEIVMASAAFTADDIGREITPSGSVSNDAIKVIAEIISPTEVRTVEQDLVTEGAGFGADISAFPQFGKTPAMIKEAAILYASYKLDPLATRDPVQAAIKAGRLRRMTVRDQSIGLDADPNLVAQAGSSLTGYPDVDALLIPFIRPPRLASA